MADKQKIIKYSEQLGFSNREIARQLGLNRKTVNRYIQAYRQSQTAECGNLVPDSSYFFEPPTYKPPLKFSSALTPEVISIIEDCLQANRERKQIGLKKICYKGIDIHEKLIANGHEIGYSTVCSYLSTLKKTAQEVFIKQQYNYGEICEFDWGYLKLYIAGKLRQFYIAIFTLAKSNYRYAILYQRQDTLAFMESHVAFFEHLGKIPHLLVYDNMKVAVRRFIGKHTKEPTAALLGMEAYYGFDHRFCNTCKGNEKGHVEKSVEYVRRKTYVDKLEFQSLEEANAHLHKKLSMLNDKTIGSEEYSIMEMKEMELKQMLPNRNPMECFQMEEYRVDKSSTICINTNHYSVPEKHTGAFVKAKLYSNKIVVYHNNNIICEHPRCYQSGKWILSLSHYLYTLIKKPGALEGSVALSQTTVFIRHLYDNHFKGDFNREFIELLIYCKENKISHKILDESYLKLLKQDIKAVNKDNLIYLLGSNFTTNEVVKPICVDQNDEIANASYNVILQIEQKLNQLWN